MKVFAVTVESPYGDDGQRFFEVEAVDYADALDTAKQAVLSGREKIVNIEEL